MNPAAFQLTPPPALTAERAVARATEFITGLTRNSQPPAVLEMRPGPCAQLGFVDRRYCVTWDVREGGGIPDSIIDVIVSPDDPAYAVQCLKSAPADPVVRYDRSVQDVYTQESVRAAP